MTVDSSNTRTSMERRRLGAGLRRCISYLNEKRSTIGRLPLEMIAPSMLIRAATLRIMTTKLVVNPFPSTLHRSFANASVRYAVPKDTHDLTQQPSSHPAVQAVLNNPDIMDSLKHWVQVLQKNGALNISVNLRDNSVTMAHRSAPG